MKLVLVISFWCLLATSGCTPAVIGKYDRFEQYRTRIGDHQFVIEIPGGRNSQFPFTAVSNLNQLTGGLVDPFDTPTRIFSAHWVFPIGEKYGDEGMMGVVVHVYEPPKGFSGSTEMEMIESALIDEYKISTAQGFHNIGPPTKFRVFMIGSEQWIRYNEPIHGTYYWSLAKIVDRWRFVNVYIDIDLARRNPDWLPEARAKAEAIVQSLRIEKLDEQN